MADVRQIIKKMREDGLSAEEAKASLAELGFANADALVNEIYGASAGAGAKPSAAQAAASEGAGGEEGEGKELFGGQEKAGEEKEEEAEEVEEKPASAEAEKIEIPELRITRIEGGEEKEVSIEEMLKSASTSAGGEPALTKAEAASLKAKLDETISLLKALQEINRKILEAEREVLMRLK